MSIQTELQHGEMKFLITCDYCNGLIADPADGMFTRIPLRFAHSRDCAQALSKSGWQPLATFLDRLGRNFVGNFI